MELSDTDFRILSLCSENRETPANLAAHLDVTPNYVSKELGKLRELELIQQPGPADNSGMYITTELGEFVVSKDSVYERAQAELFAQLAENAVGLANDLNREDEEQSIEPGDIVISSMDAYELLHRFEDADTLQPGEIAEPEQMNLFAVRGLLYELVFFEVVDRQVSADGEMYSLTQRGREVLDQPPAETVSDVNRVWLGLPKQDVEPAQGSF
ncbi:winged helix-turn-helix domain-containing protein [Natrarchaeobaculum sulfurireducens]|uniref:winged helix-turn-helix domain-containing protein n=1 Tax=Natrarchaeobaculum sulfurireducens TaxID=2044521 RepID=UPI000E3BBC11|nr:winged helix-turn-helix domain-containing protein [Natrarchaeobaculum sulfurireducens]